MWELHDNGDLIYYFTDEVEKHNQDGDYYRKFGYDENKLLLKEEMVEAI